MRGGQAIYLDGGFSCVAALETVSNMISISCVRCHIFHKARQIKREKSHFFICNCPNRPLARSGVCLRAPSLAKRQATVPTGAVHSAAHSSFQLRESEVPVLLHCPGPPCLHPPRLCPWLAHLHLQPIHHCPLPPLTARLGQLHISLCRPSLFYFNRIPAQSRRRTHPRTHATHNSHTHPFP